MSSKFNKMYGLVSIDQIQELDCTLLVKTANKKDLNTVINVKPFNKMFSIIDIVDSIKITKSLTPLKDSFVREKYPTFNYGAAHDLMAGKNSLYNEIYRTFIDFDLKAIPQNVVFTNAELVFYTRDRNYIEPNINLYSVDKHWDEHGITWANQPNTPPSQAELDELLIENPDYVWTPPQLITKNEDNLKGKTEVRFDLTHVIQQWKNGEILEHGLMVALSNELNGQYKNFYSRESGFYTTPRLFVTYYDPNPPSLGRYDLDNSLYIKAISDTDLPIEIEVLPPLITKTENDLDCLIDVKNNSYLDSEIFIIKPNLDCSLQVETPLDLASELSIISKENFDTPSSVKIFRSSLDSVIEIRNSSDIDSEITIHRNKSLDGEVTVRRREYTDLSCELLVMHKADVDSEIAIQNHAYSDVISKLIARDNKDGDLSSAIDIHLNNDLNSSVSVSQPILSSELEVSMPMDVDSQVTVQNNKHLDIESAIEVHNINDLLNKLTVSNADVEALIEITRQKSLDSAITIQRYDDFDLQNKLSVQLHDEQDVNSIIEVTNSKDVECILSISNAEVDSVIDVHYNADINSSLIVRRNEDCDVNSYLYTKNSYIENELIVMRNEDYDIISSISVEPTKDLDSEIEIHNYNELISKLVIRIPFASDVDTLCEVRNKSILDCEISVRNYKLNDINTTLTARRNESTEFSNDLCVTRHDNCDLTNSLSVQRYGIDDVKSEIILLKDEDVSSSLLVVNFVNNDLSTYIQTRPHNKMYGLLDIVPAEELVYTANPIQDSYVRKSRPLFNYGMVNDMFVGENGTDIYRSYLQFKKPKLPNSIYVLNAKIRMYVSIARDFVGSFELCSLDNSWLEQGITWDNSPSILSGATIKYAGSTLQQYVEIDIKDYVDTWINGTALDNGFVIKSADESINKYASFYTRESKFPPELVINYLDLTVVSQSKADVDNEIMIFTPGNEDVDCTILVPSYDGDIDINGEFEVRNNSYLYANIVVTTGTIDSVLVVQNNINDDLESTISIFDESYYELSSNVQVYNDFINGELVVKNHSYLDVSCMINVHNNKDLITSLSVANNSELDLDATIHINREILSSIIDVVKEKSLNSELVVQRNESWNLDASIDVVHSNGVKSVLRVLYPDMPLYLESAVYIQDNDENDVVSFVDVSYQSSILSKINVSPMELNCILEVTHCSNLDASIKVLSTKDINSDIAVRNYDTNDIDVAIEILPNSQIDSVIKVLGINDLSSRINVVIGSYVDCSNELEVDISNSILGDICVMTPAINEFDALISIFPTCDYFCELETFPAKDLDCQIETREVSQKDVDSVIDVDYGKTVDCEVLVKTPNTEDIDSVVEILPTGDVDSRIEVLPASDVGCKLVVLEVAICDLDSELDVIDMLGYAFIM